MTKSKSPDQIDAKFEERARALVHADRLATVGTMVSSIVHEVNSPLTFIKANQETAIVAMRRILERCDDPETHRILEELVMPSLTDSIAGVRQIEQLLNSFRRFYKQEKTVMAIDLRAIIEDVRILTAYHLRKEKVALTVDMPPAESLLVWGNKQELMQVLANIVNNALDAFENCSVAQRRIALTIEREADTLIMTVANNGPAIPEGLSESIFESFFTTKNEERGTGLGLAIVRQIMRGMGGDIVLKDRGGKEGMVTFVCTMPAYRGEEAAQNG